MGVASMFVSSSSSIADGAVIESKLASQAVSVAKMKKEGTAGHVLTSNGAGTIPSYQVAGAGANEFTKIETKTLASDNAQIKSSGIASGTYKAFLVVYDLIGETGDGGVNMRINGDATADAYSGNTYQATGAVHAVGDLTETSMNCLGSSNLHDGNHLHGYTWILNNTNTAPKTLFNHSVQATTTAFHDSGQWRGIWKIADEVNTIEYNSATSFDVGTTFTIWGIK